MNAIHGNVGNVYLNNISQSIEISGMNGKMLDLITDGNVTGNGNVFHHIIIEAGGYVGTPDVPFEFWADGYVNIFGALGTWGRNLYVPKQQAPSIVLVAMLILCNEVVIGENSYTLYTLIGLTKDGKLMLIGFFLCEGEADEAFWTSVLEYLRQPLYITGYGWVIHDGESELQKVLETTRDHEKFVDLSESEFDACDALIEAVELAVSDNLEDAMNEAIQSFREALTLKLESSFESGEMLLEELSALGEEFTKDNAMWIPSGR